MIVSTAAVSSVVMSVGTSNITTAADISMVDVGGAVAGGDAGVSTAQEEDIDIDSLMDLDFMATTTTTVTASVSLDATAPHVSEGDDESEDSGDEEGVVGDGDEESTDSDDFMEEGYEKVMVGGKMVVRKRKRAEEEMEDITDPSFIPEFDSSPPPRSSTPVATVVSVAASQPTSSRARRGKRSRFSFQRRSELTTAATTTVTSVAAVSVSSLTRSRATHVHATTAPLITSVSQAHIFTTASAGPSISQADMSIPTVSVVDQ